MNGKALGQAEIDGIGRQARAPPAGMGQNNRWSVPRRGRRTSESGRRREGGNAGGWRAARSAVRSSVAADGGGG